MNLKKFGIDLLEGCLIACAPTVIKLFTELLKDDNQYKNN